MVFPGDGERKEEPIVRVVVPWFPSSDAAWGSQLCSQQAFDLPRRPSLEFPFSSFPSLFGCLDVAFTLPFLVSLYLAHNCSFMNKALSQFECLLYPVRS